MSRNASRGVQPSPVLLFDGVCNLCTGLVQWVIEHDPDGVIRFASLQSDAGQHLLDEHDLPSSAFETMVLVENDEVYTKSSAALRLAKHLGLPYALLYPAVIIPRGVRDRVYDVVANNRYEWFGQRDTCMRPTPDLQDRFIEHHPPTST